MSGCGKSWISESPQFRFRYSLDAMFGVFCSGNREERMMSDEPETEAEGSSVYARVLDATIAVARSAPATPSHNAFAARISWSKVTELRDALDAAGLEWRD